MDYEYARRMMVEHQIRANRVSDPMVVEAMETVPRERFVPKALQDIAYVDEDLKIGEDRYLVEPMALGRMLQTLGVQPGDTALTVGSGSGYAAAVLGRMASAVVAVESDEGLVEQSTKTLTDLGLDNVAVVAGEVLAGYPAQAPYDVILVEGAVPEVPPVLIEQLAEGGRLIAVVRSPDAPMGHATLIEKTDGIVGRREVFDAALPPLPGAPVPVPSFVFG